MSDTANPLTTGISRTCIYTAAGRAIGARDPDPSVRNPDSLAETLLGDPTSFNITHASVRALGLSYDEAMKDLEVVNTVRTMMVRTRFIDEALEQGVADGAAHVVILGAGFGQWRGFPPGRAAPGRLRAGWSGGRWGSLA